MLELILAGGVAIIVSALCSVTEAVLYSIPWSYIEKLKKQGKPSGALLYELRADVERPITAILTLNTIANTAGASVAGAAAVRVFGSQSMGYFAAAFTLAILVLSEILPKTMGVAYARVLAPYLAQPLTVLVRLFTPLIWVGGALTRLVRPASTGPQTTEEDIRAVVSLTRKSGRIQAFEELTIKNILMMNLKTVSDIMTPRTVVFSQPDELTVAAMGELKDFWHYSRVPVYENDDPEAVVGVVYRRDVLQALANDEDEKTLRDVMRPVFFVLETLSLDKLLKQFLESRVHMLVVLDEYGGLSGLVTLEDVVEEILGREIVDESDAHVDLRALAMERRAATLRAAGMRHGPEKSPE